MGRSTPTTAFDGAILNICMKELASEKIIFDKMTAVRLRQFSPNNAFVYA